MIEARELSMRFGALDAVRGASFKVAPGEVVGYLGPNGAGKSTTMRMLTGFMRPSAGTATVCGFDVRHGRRKAQSMIGYLPEAAEGYGHLTGLELLRFCAEARGYSGAARNERIAKLCKRLELGRALSRRLKDLSKGWRQRVWLGQALLADPPVLILDEPTDGLDPNQKDQVRSLIAEIAKDKAVLLSTHVLEEAEEVCDRIIIIVDGRIVADAPRAALADESGRLGPAFRRLTVG